MNIRIWHGAHTNAEPQPPENITLTVQFLMHRLKGWFVGEWGLVKHSRMPQDFSSKGSYKLYHQIFAKWSKEVLGFSLLRSLESNVIRNRNVYGIDGDPKKFDALIASIHTTTQCGWKDGTSADDFFSAYRQIGTILERSGKRASLGHMMYYAEGGDLWVKRYVDVLQLYAKTDIAVGIFLGTWLRRKIVWKKEDLYHPTLGLTVLQPWALPYVQSLRNLKLSLDWDAHEKRDANGLNQRNLSLFCDTLEKEGILGRFQI